MMKLFVVGTPIGNLSDLSPRAAATLEAVDFIAAEDTRVTLKLLNHLGIKKPLISYFEHNRTKKGTEIIARILSGESCALVTDAGMPAISDPGEELVRQAHEAGVEVESVPGPTAFATALAVSGMPSGRFTFEGFVSQNRPARAEHLESLRNETRTMIFYEAPHKLTRTLRDFEEIFGGDRSIALVRELTKLHEEVVRTDISGARALYSEDNPPRGEFVVIVGGKPVSNQAPVFTLDDAVALAKELKEGGASASDAAKQAAAACSLKKSDVYRAMQKEREQ